MDSENPAETKSDMKSHQRSVRLSRSDSSVLTGACLTFAAVPFSSPKPVFGSDVIAFLDTLFDLLLEKRRQLKDSADDVYIRLSSEELYNLCVVLESILDEYASNDMELELHVGRRDQVFNCLNRLRQLKGDAAH